MQIGLQIRECPPILRGNIVRIAHMVHRWKSGLISVEEFNEEYAALELEAEENSNQFERETNTLYPARRGHSGVAPVQTPVELRIPADVGMVKHS